MRTCFKYTLLYRIVYNGIVKSLSLMTNELMAHYALGNPTLTGTCYTTISL